MKNKNLKKENKTTNNLLNRNIREFNVILLALIAILIIGLAGTTSFALFSSETSSIAKITGTVVRPKGPTGAETLIKKVGTDGLVAQTHPQTEQLQATTAYRYTGKNPNNYISFNNELWRIIGVFEVDDGTGNLEKRIKIIRDSIGDIAWDSNGTNDWSKATGMTLLNSGDYYKQTGSYASNGLNDDTKLMIDDAKWYLGGAGVEGSFTVDIDYLAQEYYARERGTKVWGSIGATSWTGKVGLMYPSDYVYATSGGSTTNRDACLAKSVTAWNTESISDCKNNNWLYDSSSNQWTIMQYIGMSEGEGTAIFINANGDVSVNKRSGVSVKNAFRPSVYLKSDIQIIGGTGTESDPYTLPESGATTLIKKVGTGGLVSTSHPETEQLQATTAYRYIGQNPDNYVSFNNELWRAIGVFDVDDGTGNLEQRIKLIRNESIGNIQWDSTGTIGINDWTQATGMTLLNSGDYWNRTGDYASTGLTEEAKKMTGDAKWYLGATDSSLIPPPADLYNHERGTAVFSGPPINYVRPTSWTGKVGLMYASDYGYATDGGSTVNREECLTTTLYQWGKEDKNNNIIDEAPTEKKLWDCHEKDWLYFESGGDWTLTLPRSPYGISIAKQVGFTVFVNNKNLQFRPTVYLKANIKITGGTGTSTDPYQLSL